MDDQLIDLLVLIFLLASIRLTCRKDILYNLSGKELIHGEDANKIFRRIYAIAAIQALGSHC